VEDVAAVWNAAPVDDTVLPPPGAGVNTDYVQTRNSMPVPHEYTQAVINLNSNGSISWHRLWDVVGAPIVADPVQLKNYQPFIDYLPVSSMQ
jgi:hypothetical protein